MSDLVKMSEVFTVSELRKSLRDAALGVGYTDDETITRHGAIRAWAQWKLGDPEWAEAFVAFYKFPTAERETEGTGPDTGEMMMDRSLLERLRKNDLDECYEAADRIEQLEAENARLTNVLTKERLENLWNAYNTGHEKDGEWNHHFMSDGEWLVRECGLDPKTGRYDAAEIKALIPQVAIRAAQIQED